MPKLLEGPRAIGHLLRRAGFGPDSASWETYAGRTDYDAVVDELLAALDTKAESDPDGFDPFVPGAIQQLWLERIVSGKNALAENPESSAVIIADEQAGSGILIDLMDEIRLGGIGSIAVAAEPDSG